MRGEKDMYHTLGGSCSRVYGREFPMNSVVLDLEKATFVCTDFHQPRKKDLRVFCYIHNEKKWVITFLNNELKETLWMYYRRNIRKRSTKNYSYLMRHDRKKKKSAGGVLGHKDTVTDYECTKNPMHDFRRVYI